MLRPVLLYACTQAAFCVRHMELPVSLSEAHHTSSLIVALAAQGAVPAEMEVEQETVHTPFGVAGLEVAGPGDGGHHGGPVDVAQDRQQVGRDEAGLRIEQRHPGGEHGQLQLPGAQARQVGRQHLVGDLAGELARVQWLALELHLAHRLPA